VRLDGDELVAAHALEDVVRGHAERLCVADVAQQLGLRSQSTSPATTRSSVIVPCHRVVGKDGKLTGYAGGLRRKQFLLSLEAPPHSAPPLS
jgi:methylated-DNA-[protein]-cysteine S-methyltransferase